MYQKSSSIHYTEGLTVCDEVLALRTPEVLFPQPHFGANFGDEGDGGRCCPLLRREHRQTLEALNRLDGALAGGGGQGEARGGVGRGGVGGEGRGRRGGGRRGDEVGRGTVPPDVFSAGPVHMKAAGCQNK